MMAKGPLGILHERVRQHVVFQQTVLLALHLQALRHLGIVVLQILED